MTASRGGEAIIWNASGQQLMHKLAHPEAVWFIAFRFDSGVALTSCGDGVVRLWDVPSGQPLPVELKHAYTAWKLTSLKMASAL